VRLRWWTLGSVAVGAGGMALADGHVSRARSRWSPHGRLARPKERLPRHRRAGVDDQRDVMVDAFLAAKIIGGNDGLAFVARPDAAARAWR
jgi:hypothetical protein